MKELTTVTITSTWPNYDLLPPGQTTRALVISDSLRRIITGWRLADIAAGKREREPAEPQQGHPMGDCGSTVPSSRELC